MNTLDRIRQPISEELIQFEQYFKENMKTQVPLLDVVIKYVMKRKGKQMRPILVLLITKLFGKPNDSTYTAAALIEILHTASIIHDDVVDDSHERRGFFSVNAIWKSKIAVLLGDYLLAKGMLLALSKKEYEILNIVADAVREMSEGELLQIRNSRKLSIVEEEYYEIIRKKTAALISCCSSCGAKSVGMDDNTVKQMHDFGELLGIAFQIKDDLLDYQLNSLKGKPTGNDLKEKKLTLPLIHALEIADSTDKKKILSILNNSKINSVKFTEIYRLIIKYNGLSYSEQKMKEYSTKAIESLYPFSGSELYDSLKDFIYYVTERNK
jgi:octaprenyl-diphosphate synthase